jgi:hypothetical protein
MLRAFAAVGVSLLFTLTGAGADIARPPSERFGAADADEPASFRRHVLPLLGRLGCNGRACHGSFQGQGGFRLSLFGYDFKSDHQALTKGEMPRVDLSNPLESLILEKPTLTISHKGGKRLDSNGWQYRLLVNWIRRGAIDDSQSSGRFQRLVVTPAEVLYHEPGESCPLRVTAYWSGAPAEDVTELCRFRTNDESVARVDESGRVTSAGKGDTHVVAFYDNGVAPVSVILPVSDRAGDRYPHVPTPTTIDKLVVGKLRKCGIVPSDLCSDAEFLRRASLDVTGTLPAAAEVEAFLADPSPEKHSRKIDELLERPSYAAWWTTKLCDWTGNNGVYRGDVFGADYARQWYEWIYRRVRENAGYDEIMAGIILASSRQPEETFEQFSAEMSGYFRKDSPADFAVRPTMPHFWSRRTAERPEDKAIGVSYAFLGVHLQCAQCHKHPFDQWTKQDFEQFTALFRPIVYGTPPADREAFSKMQAALNKQISAIQGKKAQVAAADLIREGTPAPWREVYVAMPGDIGVAKGQPKAPSKKQPPTPKPIRGRLLGGQEVTVAPGDDPRQALWEWMIRPDNPYFARALVNRVWASYFNAGIVEPADDLNLANPPSNAPLLDYLSKEFVRHGYDLKWLHREITNSRTYQLSWRSNPTNRLDSRNFSRAVPRRVPAESAYDAIAEATAGSRELSRWNDDADRHMIAIDSQPALKARLNSRYLLTVFGKPDRVNNCDCERSNDASLLQTLFLQNDGEIQGLLDRPGGWLAGVARSYGLPTPGIKQKAAEKIAAAPGKDAKTGEKRPPSPEALQKKRPRVPSPNEERRLIREAYLRSVSRPPTDKETVLAEHYLNESENIALGLRDLLWALINTDEFILNH